MSDFDEQIFLRQFERIREQRIRGEGVTDADMNQFFLRVGLLLCALIATRMQLMQARREAGTAPLFPSNPKPSCPS